jgi:hypothetical protein
LTVSVPLTVRDPVTGAEAQLAPASDGSSVPATFRHDAVTAQVPTTSPPHADTPGQGAPPVPPALVVPAPPDAPPAPGVPPAPELHPAAHNPAAIAHANASFHAFMTTIGVVWIGLLTNYAGATIHVIRAGETGDEDTCSFN